MRNLNVSAHSACELEEHEYCVAVGMLSHRTKTRIRVLLNVISGCHAKFIDAENETALIVKEADLVIGGGDVAREGILHRKPVIVVGDYGFGGLVTPDTFHSQYNNGFRGRINGMKDEYFALDRLEEEIKKSTNLTFHELQMMSNQIITFLHNINF